MSDTALLLTNGRHIGPAGPRQRRPAPGQPQFIWKPRLLRPRRFCMCVRVAGWRDVCLMLCCRSSPGCLLNPDAPKRQRWTGPAHVCAPPKKAPPDFVRCRREWGGPGPGAYGTGQSTATAERCIESSQSAALHRAWHRVSQSDPRSGAKSPSRRAVSAGYRVYAYSRS